MFDMRKLVCCAAAAAALLAPTLGAVTAKKKAPARKTATTASTTRKPVSGKKPGVTTASRHGKKPLSTPTTWRNRQTTPSPERYREIQGALAAKGYLKPEDSNGSWNQTSTDALKRFQMEQNLEPTGKINSLSLIALGLGPKHEAPAPPKVADTGTPQ
jgi:hypothetical protein